MPHMMDHPSQSPLSQSLRTWAESQGIPFDLSELPAPPPLLSGVPAATPSPGLCLTIHEPPPTPRCPPPQLGFWFPADGSPATTSAFREGVDEILTSRLDIPDPANPIPAIAEAYREFLERFSE